MSSLCVLQTISMSFANRICFRYYSNIVQRVMRHSTKSSITANETSKKNIIESLNHPDYFGVQKLVTVEDLFNARVHYGHMEGCRNHTMAPYIFGSRNGVDVIDLDQTHKHLILALNLLSHIVYRGGLILFIMHSHIFGHQVEVLAKECGEYAHTRKYRRDVLLEHNPDNSAKLPDLCVFLSLLDNVNTQHPCIVDSAKVNIPTIGIADTNTDMSLITYPVPGNDDSLQALNLYCHLFKTCIKNAKERRETEIM